MTTHIGIADAGAPSEAPVTRVEIIDHIGDAFTGPSLSRSDLVGIAADAGARRRLVDLLARLPDRHFRHPHELWVELPEVPIEL